MIALIYKIKTALRNWSDKSDIGSIVFQFARSVFARIIESWYGNPREVLLFFYYPADEYISYLMTVDELEFYDEIECDDLFEGKDSRERIMIFQLPDYDPET